VERIIVIGAGVIGLTTAVRLLEDGHRVDILARDLPLETTSAVAAALWYPYLALPVDRVTAWSAASYECFARLAANDETGVRLRQGTEVLREPSADPWWAEAVPDLERTAAPAGYADAWTFVAPVIEMPVYLRWLVGRVESLGGTITRMALGGLPTHAGVVVNATGLGARHSADDLTVQPVQGQVVYLSQVGLDRWWLDESGPTYVVPRSHDIVVGGTDREGEWSREPDDRVGADILARCRALVPELAEARVLGARIGLRPKRPAVRLEEGHLDGHRVIHNYGHGGAGVTLSWGCADEVAALVGTA
jgi:D-amino-acid oxidase